MSDYATLFFIILAGVVLLALIARWWTRLVLSDQERTRHGFDFLSLVCGVMKSTASTYAECPAPALKFCAHVKARFRTDKETAIALCKRFGYDPETGERVEAQKS